MNVSEIRPTLWISIEYVEPEQISEWIGYRRSNRNYFTLSKSCYLCIFFLCFFFLLFVEPDRKYFFLFCIMSVYVFFLPFSFYSVWNLNLEYLEQNFLHNIRNWPNKSGPYQWKIFFQWFSDFRKCNIEMRFCYHEQPSSWISIENPFNGNCSSQFVQLTTHLFVVQSIMDGYLYRDLNSLMYQIHWIRTSVKIEL